MNAKSSNELVNELVSACIAFVRRVEPDWQTRINKAQRELREYIAELEEKQRWIPVSERLPEDGEPVLAAYVDTMLTAAYYRHHIAFGGVDNWWDVEGCHTGNPTHWLPLPESPEVQE